MKKNILKIFSENTSSTPIWLMRQAGRYLPEYKELRKSKPNFLEFCYDSKLAAEATLQPMRRFNFDAAIIFSDILVIPHALGVKVEFLENHGPLLDSINSREKLDLTIKKKNFDKLEKVYEAIKITKASLEPSKALIGFAGAPWTLAAYMVEGKLSRDLAKIKEILFKDREYILYLLDYLSENIANHLINQIQAGADLVQIFDSWAGLVNYQDYQELIVNPHNKIIKKVKQVYPEVPVISFPRMSGINYHEFAQKVECDCIGVDQFFRLNGFKNYGKNKILQGNLDPLTLLGSEKLIGERVDNIFDDMQGQRFIFNLGHGIVPNIDPSKVKFLVDYVKEKNV